MIRPVPQIACDFVAQHEGCRLQAYADVGGVWTIGYGHTLGVTQSQACTRSQANMWLEEDLSVAAKRLDDALGDYDWRVCQLTEHQYAALLSFVFNVGCSPSWTIWKKLSAGDLTGARAELGRFVYAAGKVVPGLQNRREAEQALWDTPDGATPAPVVAPSSAVTRDAVQPIPHSTNRGLFSRLWSALA